MLQKTFLALALLFTSILTMPVSANTPRELRAVKITNVDSDVLFSDASIAEAMDFCAEIGINVILPVVWNGSGADGTHTLYPSAVMDSLFGRSIHPAFAGRDPLKRLIIEAHRNGMEVMPWFEMGFSPSYSQDGGYILDTYPHWACRNNQGDLVVKNGFDWMSAIHPKVQSLVMGLTLEVIKQYDVDGIEYSDRIPAMPVEGGYETATVELYQSEHDGALPPSNPRHTDWKRWRADKLSDFFQAVHDSVKALGDHLVVSSSPSLYPWGYDEYLQDAKTWIETGMADNLIPQLYRYTFDQYVYELNKTLSTLDPSTHDLLYAGILMNVGSYLITPDFLHASIIANRDRGVQGEAFFFYEGLRKNRNKLGLHLKETVYSEPAIVPHRNDRTWRPGGVITDETTARAERSGTWRESTTGGYNGSILVNDTSDPASVRYSMEIPASAWYTLYVYGVTGSNASKTARYTLYPSGDSLVVMQDQTDFRNRGWYPLTTLFLEAGQHQVVKLDNGVTTEGRILVADAVMALIHRQKSPDAVITSVSDAPSLASPQHYRLSPAYPNPFNSSTTFDVTLSRTGPVSIDIYDITGRRVDTLVNGVLTAGSHRISWDAGSRSSGVYFVHLRSGHITRTRKLTLIR